MADNNTDDWGNADKKSYDARSIPITPENKFIYQIGICALAAVSVVSIVGMIGLASYGKEIPQALTAIGSLAIGALGTLFSQSR